MNDSPTNLGILRWLEARALPETLYDLLEAPRFSPDAAGLIRALRAANRELWPYQNHVRPEVARRAMRLLIELGRADRILADPEMRKAYDSELVSRLHAEYLERERDDPGTWSDAAVRAWLGEQKNVHPARLDELTARIRDARQPTDASISLELEPLVRDIGLEEGLRYLLDQSAAEAPEAPWPELPQPGDAVWPEIHTEPITPRAERASPRRPPPVRSGWPTLRQLLPIVRRWLGGAMITQLEELEQKWALYYVQQLGRPWPFHRAHLRQCVHCARLHYRACSICKVCGERTIGRDPIGIGTGLDAGYQAVQENVHLRLQRLACVLLLAAAVPVGGFFLIRAQFGTVPGLAFLGVATCASVILGWRGRDRELARFSQELRIPADPDPRETLRISSFLVTIRDRFAREPPRSDDASMRLLLPMLVRAGVALSTERLRDFLRACLLHRDYLRFEQRLRAHASRLKDPYRAFLILQARHPAQAATLPMLREFLNNPRGLRSKLALASLRAGFFRRDQNGTPQPGAPRHNPS